MCDVGETFSRIGRYLCGHLRQKVCGGICKRRHYFFGAGFCGSGLLAGEYSVAQAWYMPVSRFQLLWGHQEGGCNSAESMSDV